MSTPFIAQITIFPFNFAPRGWSFCKAQLLPIASNTALFSLIGTTYGGDGRTTMGLPDFQGRLGMNDGRGPGLTPRTLGQKGGESTHTLTLSELPAHDHQRAGFKRGTDEDSKDATDHFLGDRQIYSTTPTPGHTLGGVGQGGTGNGLSDAVGGSQPHENMMPFLTMNYCISLQGQYPSRS